MNTVIFTNKNTLENEVCKMLAIALIPMKGMDFMKQEVNYHHSAYAEVLSCICVYFYIVIEMESSEPGQ